jgi:hypothetical protein
MALPVPPWIPSRLQQRDHEVSSIPYMAQSASTVLCARGVPCPGQVYKAPVLTLIVDCAADATATGASKAIPTDVARGVAGAPPRPRVPSKPSRSSTLFGARRRWSLAMNAFNHVSTLGPAPR